MAARWWAAIYSFSLTMSLALTAVTIKPATDEIHGDINDVIISLEKLLGYYKQDIEVLNLDGFFGLRVLEGHLLQILEEFKAEKLKNVAENVLPKIQKLAKTASHITAEGLEYVRKDNPKYFDDFSPVVKKPWAVLKQQRKLESSLRWEIPQYKAKLKIELSEKLSDKCLKELLRNSSSECVISDQCVKIMTTRGLTGYSITHQLLWSMMAENSVICKNTLIPLLKKHGIESISSFQLEMCTNNFYEMVAVVHVLMKGTVHPSHQDLFLEQQFVCPSLGFHEFLKKDYLDQILSWQFPSGCFGEDEEEYEDEDEDYIDVANLLESYHNKHQEMDKDANKEDVWHMVQQNSLPSKGKINKSPKSLHVIPHHESKSKNLRVNGLLRAEALKLSSLPLPSDQPHKVVSADNMSADVHSNQIQADRHQHLSADSLPVPVNPSDLNKRKSQTHAASNGAKSFSPHPVKVQKGQLPNRPKTLSLSHRLAGEMKDKTRQGRKLLVEKELPGGCLSHKTGVGAGALVIYLHYLIRQGDVKWDGPHELFQKDRQNLIQHNGKLMTHEDFSPVLFDKYGNDESDEEADEEDGDGIGKKEDYDVEKEEYDDYAKQYDELGNAETGKEGILVEPKNGQRQRGTKERNSVNEIGQGKMLDQNVLNRNDVDGDNEFGGKQDVEDHFYDDEIEDVNSGVKKEIDLNQKLAKTYKKQPDLNVLRQQYKQEIDDTSSNVFYGHVGEEIFSSSHPSTLLVILVSVSPILIVSFFLYRFIKCNRIPCINYYL